jgi:hypothetical protein
VAKGLTTDWNSKSFENVNELAIPLLGIKVLGSFGIKDECPQTHQIKEHWLLWQIHPKQHAWTPAKQRMASESTMSTRTMYMKLGNAQHLDVKWLKWLFKCASNIIFMSRDAHRLVRRCQWLRISFCAGAPANSHVRHWSWRGRRSIWNFGLEHVAMRNDNITHSATLLSTMEDLGCEEFVACFPHK